MWMLMSVRTYYNNEELVEMISALRKCIDRRHHALYKKIYGGLECSTIENVKLTLIAYLLIQYQAKGETTEANNCLQSTDSAREGWKIINTFLDYVSRECRDCITTVTAVGTAATSPGTSPTPFDTLVTQAGNTLTTQGGDTLITQ